MNRYNIHHYDLTDRDHPVEGDVQIEAASAADALYRAGHLPGSGTVSLIHNLRPDAWADQGPLAAGDNAHFQRDPITALIGALAWRIL